MADFTMRVFGQITKKYREMADGCYAEVVSLDGDIETVTVTIANGASLSDEVDVGEGRVLVGILMPAAWTAASMTFQAGAVSGALGNLYDEYGTEVEYTVDASRYVAVDIPTFASARYVKVRSGTSGTPVSQAAERTITLVTRPL